MEMQTLTQPISGAGVVEWLTLAASLLLALAGLAAAVRLFRRARMMEYTAAVRVNLAPQGLVKLSGLAAAYGDTPLLAPLTQTPCVWYSYRIEEMSEGQYGRKRRWRTIQSDNSEHLFVLRDETGDCLIDPEGGEVSPMNRQQWYGNTPVAADALAGTAGANALLAHNLSGRQYRFTEQRIHTGDPLYALGAFRTVAAQDELPEEKDAVRELLRAWKQSPEVIARYDADGDGKLQPHEWEQVVAAARVQVQEEFRQASRLPAHHVLSRPRDGQPLILSSTSQPKALQRYYWPAMGAFMVFVVFSGVAMTLFSAAMGQ